MVPAVHSVLAVVLACLTFPPAGVAPGRGAARVEAGNAAVAPALSRDGNPRAVDTLPAPSPGEIGERFLDREDDDESSARSRPAHAPPASATAAGPARGQAVSTHPAFHAVPRSRFLVCGRLTC